MNLCCERKFFTDRGGFNCSAYQHPGRRKFIAGNICSANGVVEANEKYVEDKLVTGSNIL